MPSFRVASLASAFREVRGKFEIIPAQSDTAEETARLQPQHHVDPGKWGVATIESWSKRDGTNISPKNLWDHMVYFLADEPTSVRVVFRFFLDGIQRTTPIGSIRLKKSTFESVPIHFAQIGVALLERIERRLIKANEEVQFLVEFPAQFAEEESNRPELKDGFLREIIARVGTGIADVDTSFRAARLKKSEEDRFTKFNVLDGIKYPRLPNDELWRWCSDPALFRGHARRWTTRFRDLAEQKLYDWALEKHKERVSADEYSFVVKDGSLTHIRGGLEKAALGVIKTFGTTFLDQANMSKVFGLQEGYRSPVVTKTRPGDDPEEFDPDEPEEGSRKLRLLTWYIRIRPPRRYDPTWGLLRIELHSQCLPCEGHVARWTQRDTEIVDGISKCLLLERWPSSRPDPRWNNLIYPIRSCETYLRSRIVSHVTARFLLGGA